MIVKRNLSPVQIVRYTAGPMLWAGGWAVAAPIAYHLTDDDRIVLPFPVVGTLAAALAIFIAFRNNTTTWLAAPLALAISGTFVVMAVTGAANDEPFANKVTDVPIDAICTELERDVASTVGGLAAPEPLRPTNGYLW